MIRGRAVHRSVHRSGRRAVSTGRALINSIHFDSGHCLVNHTDGRGDADITALALRVLEEQPLGIVTGFRVRIE